MQELALAHEIQQGYLPEELEGFPGADFEIFGRVFPARQVAGAIHYGLTCVPRWTWSRLTNGILGLWPRIPFLVLGFLMPHLAMRHNQ